jgi:P-type E1-E2 ATPase
VAALGLTSDEARRRLEAAPPAPPPRGSRSYRDIVWSNTFTVFNLILGTLLVLVLVFGDPRDGLFGLVIVANTAIGIVQEVRAKRTLDRLSLLAAPRAHAWRDGELAELPVDRVVVGDALHLQPGDQVVADGRVIEARALSLDESILTGESDQVTKAAGDEVLSGAYCAAGSGDYEVEGVGADSYAERMALEARGTRAVLSPLQQDINRVLTITVGAMVPLAIALVIALAIQDRGVTTSIETAAAALVPLVPEGLVLLTSLTFAVAAVRLGRMGTLAQRLNAVESLASVDTVCFDKTGTLTDNRIRLEAVEPAPGTDEDGARRLLGALAASAGARNATTQAIAEGIPAEAEPVAAEVPFSSARKWSAVQLDGAGTLVLGAPDILARGGVPVPADLRAAIDRHARERRRVVLLARTPRALDGEELPAGLEPVGIALLVEGLRDEAVGAVSFLASQGVDLKVISGDGVDTVQAVALAAGVPGAERAVAGPDLPGDDGALADAALRTTVFGRVTPEQKQRLVAGLTGRGRYVAMCGDGVNDVLALKQARLAIAMGNGSQMAKGVSDLVLLSNRFATVPAAVEEGRRIIRNTHRVAKLFVAKSVYSAALLATFGLAPIAFPFLPRHLSVTSSLTIGIPAFFLALSKSSGPVRREGFLRSLAAFVVPAGLIAATAIAAVYLIVRGPLDLPVIQGRSAAVVVATAVGLAIVIEVERGVERRKVRPWVWGMVAAFALAFTVGLHIEPLRDFFAVEIPDADAWWAIAACSAGGIALLVTVRHVPWLARMEAGPSGPNGRGPEGVDGVLLEGGDHRVHAGASEADRLGDLGSGARPDGDAVEPQAQPEDGGEIGLEGDEGR